MSMLSLTVSFIVMLNPFALFLYLCPVMKELTRKDFMKVLLKATIISYIIYLIFVLTGDILFNQIFRINFSAFRIFGGIIIFSYAYYYIVKGQKALIKLRGSLDDLASEIALPFMVGAGTISIAILMGNELSIMKNMMILPLILVINYLIIISLMLLRHHIFNQELKIAFDKSMGILLRISGFFVGAIGINMITKGIKNLYFV